MTNPDPTVPVEGAASAAAGPKHAQPEAAIEGQNLEQDESTSHATIATAGDKQSEQEVGHTYSRAAVATDPRDEQSTTKSPTSPPQSPKPDRTSRALGTGEVAGVSAFSHQQMAPHEPAPEAEEPDDGGWQTMPAYAQYDLYDDDGKLIARAHDPDAEDQGAGGGKAKGYSRVQIDEDAKSTTSMDDNTAYLFKDKVNNDGVGEDMDDEVRDPLEQMQATKNLLSENQKVAYVGLVRLAIAEMARELDVIPRSRAVRKCMDLAVETNKMFTQKVMIRLYSHMELSQAEQVMIEQLAEHGLQAADLTPALMQNSRVHNPVYEKENKKPDRSEDPTVMSGSKAEEAAEDHFETPPGSPELEPLPAYEEHVNDEMPDVQTPQQLPQTEKIDIDLRWTVLCDLFLILIADSFYDAPSRTLLEKVGKFLEVSPLDICRFEKRVTDALEMQDDHEKDTWTEEEHMEARRKRAKRRRLMMMGLATVGGSLVIGLSAGLLAPVIGAGLAAGFTTIGVSGTSSFLAGAGGAAIIGTTGVITGGTAGAKAAIKRTGAVSTFEYRPLYNNKRVNLIVTISGWLIGKVDDVRLPFSTVDPIMGDLYSIWWEPEMLTSMGQTISILATEALTQGLQQILGSTILISLMAALQLPIVLTKLSYLIDNPWSNSMARADRAGLILADSLIDRNLGARPITLVGFSIGARVIYACLQELAKRGAISLVQNVFLFGSPMVVNKDEYIKARSVVSGRFVNGFATNDWILGYLFRATAGGIMRVAGLSQIDVPGVENVDLTALVTGHMAYRQAMPRILREVGWAVTSDEFTEIEDPDPDNHEKRQRELISEIEEARREIQEKEKNEKKGFSWFRKKKAAEKKSWEIYDESSKLPPSGEEGKDPAEGADAAGETIFDIDAIRREAVDLAARGLEIKQLETTLPPLRIDVAPEEAALVSPRPRPVSMLRETKSDNAVPQSKADSKSEGQSSPSTPPPYSPKQSSPKQQPSPKPTPSRPVIPEEEEITMSFESEYKRPAWPRRFESHLSSPLKSDQKDENASRAFGGKSAQGADGEGDISAAMMHHDLVDADDEDEFKEKEVEMTFA